ncbi:MAG: GlsB/YeaQ/YmgE family stress response membrane protein [Anaerolineaceae bacterium]|nr:GlsB/YeaQ/YmgE family stress response membrane protein [Anaerolineaceae bacterium]
MLVNLILWIILGAVAGWIASMIMGRDAQMGALANIIVGIIGALLGGFLFNLIGLPGDTGFNFWTLVVATFGAIVLLFLISVVRRAA